MAKTYSYACKDYPEMEACPFHATAETQEELWKLTELHASHAHGEDPKAWSDDDKTFLKSLFTSP